VPLLELTVVSQRMTSTFSVIVEFLSSRSNIDSSAAVQGFIASQKLCCDRKSIGMKSRPVVAPVSDVERDCLENRNVYRVP